MPEESNSKSIVKSAGLPAAPVHARSSFAHPLPGAPVELPEPPSGSSLREYWRVAHARRGTIGWAVGACLAAALIYNYLCVPTYRAKATIQIDREQPNIAELDDDFRRLPEQPDYLETQYRVLKSRTLARRVIGKLDLHERAEFRVRLGDGLGRQVERSGAANPGANTPEPSLDQATIQPLIVDEYLDHLGVHPGKSTRLVDVTFESFDRELAAGVVNTLADEYIDHNLEAKWNATQKASTWLQQQLSTLQARLEASEGDLHDYATRHSILFVEERKNITTERLAQLEESLTRADAERIQEQSRAMLVEEAVQGGDELPGSLTSKIHEELQAKLIDLKREHSQLLVTLAPGYPTVRRVQRQIEEIEAALEAEKSRILSAVSESYQLARRRVELLREEVVKQRVLVNRLSDDIIQYNILKRDADTNRQLYEGLLQRLKEAGISAGLRASNVALLDRAELPEQPYRPRKWLNLFLGIFSGLLAGIVAAFVQEHMNTLVRTPEEVEQMTGLSLLAVIPRVRSDLSAKLFLKALDARTPAEEQKALAAAADGGSVDPPATHRRPTLVWQPELGLSEAYRTLRSSLLLSCDDSMRRVLVTSSQPQEGKTTISMNLACSLAQLGRRVLLIDADMRRPSCAKQLGVNSLYGLTDYLQGLAEIEQVTTETAVAGLWLAAAGRSNSAASDLLYSPRLASLLLRAGEEFQHVIIDSPPSLVLSDARTISQMVEAVIMVVSDKTESGALTRTKQTFDEAGVHFLGFVMNRVNLDNLDYGYYRDYGYYYTYSDRGESGEDGKKDTDPRDI